MKVVKIVKIPKSCPRDFSGPKIPQNSRISVRKFKKILWNKAKVANSLELGSATFWAKKRQTESQIFFTENATILIKGATIWDFFFSKWQNVRCIFIPFICDNFSQNFIFQYISNILSSSLGKIFGATRYSKIATLALKSHDWPLWIKPQPGNFFGPPNIKILPPCYVK